LRQAQRTARQHEQIKEPFFSLPPLRRIFVKTATSAKKSEGGVRVDGRLYKHPAQRSAGGKQLQL